MSTSYSPGAHSTQEKMTYDYSKTNSKENKPPTVSPAKVSYPSLPAADVEEVDDKNRQPFQAFKKTIPSWRLPTAATTTRSTDQRSVANDKSLTFSHRSNIQNDSIQSPLFVSRGQSRSHNEDLELMQSAGHQACMKRGGHQKRQPQTPPNVGRPRARLGFLTASPARASRAVRMKGIFAGTTIEVASVEAERTSNSGDSRAKIMTDEEDEDDDFEDAVLTTDLEQEATSSHSPDRADLKEKLRPDDLGSESELPGTSSRMGKSRTQLKVPSGQKKIVPVSSRSPLQPVRLPLSRENIAILDAGEVPDSSTSGFPCTTIHSASSVRARGQVNRLTTNRETTTSLSGLSPMRTLIAPPRRNPARTAKTKVEQPSAPSALQVATSAFSASSASSSSSSTPPWTDDELFLRRFSSSRHSHPAGTTGSTYPVEEDQRQSDVAQADEQDPATGEDPKGLSRPQNNVLDFDAVTIRDKRKARARFQGRLAGNGDRGI